MKNTISIFRDDLKFVKSNLISILMAIILCLAPGLYAWSGIAGSWDPYGNTSQLKIAVSNSDEGYKSDLMPISVNVGDRVVNSLHENGKYGWTFVEESEAIEGVESGKYYAAIVIPDDFSYKMMSVFSAEAERADIDYYLNMKESPVAPVLTSQNDTDIVEDIRVEFTTAVDNMTLGLADDIVSFATSDKVDGFGLQVVDQLDELADSLDKTSEQVRAFANLASASASLTDAAATSLMGSDNGADVSVSIASNVANDLQASVNAARAAALSMQSQTGKNGTSAALLDDIASLSSSIGGIASSTNALASSVKSTASGLSGSTESLSGDLGAVRDNLNVVADKLDHSANTLRQFRAELASALSSGNLAKVAQLIGDDTDGLAEWLAAPMQIQQQSLYAVANYGSSVTPFYVVFALWAGSVLLAVLLRTTMSEERLSRYEGKHGGSVENYEQYLGRCGIFVVLGLVQATITCLGLLFFLHVQCASPLLLFVACWVISIVFSCVAYTLVITFGAIGKVLCVLLLAMQVVAPDGQYPLQMMGDAFQVLTPLMPFTYGVQALQACIAGASGMELPISLGFLAIFLVAALFVGLALRPPLNRLGQRLGTKLGETGLM